jgi:hypothetical protein
MGMTPVTLSFEDAGSGQPINAIPITSEEE